METMTPKERAKQLTELFEDALTLKDCAKITVNEIMIAIDWHEFETPNEQLNYWDEVKEEIKKL
jgi:hypothetical protein